MSQQASIRSSEVSGQLIGELINLSGRQRMLSQRIVLHVLLASHGDAAALAVATSCTASFAGSHDDLVNGNDRLPGVFSDSLRQLYFGPRRADEQIRQFIVQVRGALSCIESADSEADRRVAALVAQATPLLELLQDITLAYQEEMRDIEAAATKRQNEIAEQLGKISMQANIVAFNARISAARAGSYGREFAVITTVLSDIIKEMDQLVQSVVNA